MTLTQIPSVDRRRTSATPVSDAEHAAFMDLARRSGTTLAHIIRHSLATLLAADDPVAKVVEQQGAAQPILDKINFEGFGAPAPRPAPPVRTGPVPLHEGGQMPRPPEGSPVGTPAVPPPWGTRPEPAERSDNPQPAR